MVKTTKVCIALFLLNSCSLFAYPQTIVEMSYLKSDQSSTRSKKSYLATTKDNRNEIEFVLSGLLRFYKNFISSQDGNSCTFSPSCSEYALMAVKQVGLIEGGAATFDRITRCNGLSPDKYHRSALNPALMIDSLKSTKR